MSVKPADLAAPRLPERQLHIDGVGMITVRSLSRAQALLVRTLVEDSAAMERAVLRFGVVDPALTEEEVLAWYEGAAPGEFEPILGAIQELSGLGEGASKRGVPRVRGGQ